MKDFPELVQRLSLALKSLAMYTGAHPRARAAVESATDYLHTWLKDAPSVHLATSGGRMFLDGAPFEGQSVHMAGMARLLGERQISGLIFTRGVTSQELEATLGLLILKPSRIEEKGGPLRAMAELGLAHVELGQVQYREVRENEGDTMEQAPAIRPVTLGKASALPNPEVRGGASLQPSMETLRSLVEHWRQAFRNVMDGMEASKGPSDHPGAGRGPGGHPGTGGGDEAGDLFRASTGIALDITPPSPRFGGGTGHGPGGPGAGPGFGEPGAGPGLGGPGTGHGLGGPGTGHGLGGPGGGQGPGGPGQGPEGDGGGTGLSVAGMDQGHAGAGMGPGGHGAGHGAEGPGGPGAGPGAEGPGAGPGPGGTGTGHGDPLPGAAIDGLPPGPADLSVLGATMAGAAIGDAFPEPQALDALKRALHELPPGALLSVVEGLDSLPRTPAGLRMAFTALSPEAFARATAAFLGRGAGQDQRWPRLRDRLHGILQGAADGSPAGPAASLLAALETELRNRGLGLENLKELVALLEWDKMALDDQIRALEERNNLWALSHQQRLAFLRRILDDGREDTFRRVLAQVLQGLESGDPNRREAAARTLVGVAHWLAVPGLPAASEADLLRGLQAHFVSEPLLQVHKGTVEAFAVAFAEMLARSEPGRAHAMLADLDRAVSASSDPMRREAMAWLWDRMGQPEALARVFELLHTANPESLLTELMPYLEAVGTPAARRLVLVLGEEEDRKRRVRLVEIIRGLGHLALPAMHEALESDRWYLVRNTLNILADLGDADALRPAEACLSHPDGRVRRAAVRTVWKLGGPGAVPALLAAFHQADAETLLEIMFAFGQIRATAAVPLLGAFAQDARMPGKLRARAAETLGLIGGAPAMAVLEELLKRKGRIFTTAEPTEVRAGAAKGLASMGTPQAMASLQALVEREPRNADRPVFQQILDQARR